MTYPPRGCPLSFPRLPVRTSTWVGLFVGMEVLLSLTLEYSTAVVRYCTGFAFGPVCSGGSILATWALPVLLVSALLPLLALPNRRWWWVAPLGFGIHAIVASLALWVLPGPGAVFSATLPGVLDVELATLAFCAMFFRGVRPTPPAAEHPTMRAGSWQVLGQAVGARVFGQPMGLAPRRARRLALLLAIGGSAAAATPIFIAGLGMVCIELCLPAAPTASGTLSIALLLGTSFLAIPAIADRSLGLFVPAAAIANSGAGYLVATFWPGPYALGFGALFVLLLWDLLLASAFIAAGGAPPGGRGPTIGARNAAPLG
jgi:hypothetical protein